LARPPDDRVLDAGPVNRRRVAIVPLVLALAACNTAPASPGSPSPAAPATPGSGPSLAASPSAAISPGGGTIFFGRAVAGRDAQFVLMSPDGSKEQ
jgi:hypothetical protein